MSWEVELKIKIVLGSTRRLLRLEEKPRMKKISENCLGQKSSPEFMPKSPSFDEFWGIHQSSTKKFMNTHWMHWLVEYCRLLSEILVALKPSS